MNEENILNILTRIIKSALNETDTIESDLTFDTALNLYQLAKKHDLAHFVSDFVLGKNIAASQDFELCLQKEKLMSVYRCEQLKYVLDEITALFNEAEIDHIPLKGSVLRRYYPTDSMRTSCDIDVLIRRPDLDSAVSLLESKGYKFIAQRYHDVSMCSPGNVHLELHFNLQENIASMDSILKNAWQYADPIKGSEYRLRKDFFVFYFYAHMAYHFVTGGCGIRSLMDIWVMNHKMDASYSCAEQLLKQGGIYQFAAEMSNLAEYCFADNDGDDFYKSLLRYIVDGGTYGSINNKITAKMSGTSLFVYTLKRLFLPYKTMVILFPMLKKAPFLLPFCWVARWIKALVKGKKNKFDTEIVYANNIDPAISAEMKYMLSRLGL